MDALLQDLRYAARALLRSPGFAAMAILTLALGIGVNTTLFSTVDAVLLRPLPYADAGRLVSLWMNEPGASVNKETLEALRARTPSLQGLAGYSGWGFTLTGQGEPEALAGAKGTADLFRVLGARPLLGRTFLPEDGEPGRTPAVVLGHGLWRRRFGGDRGVVGRAITLDGNPAVVVGVMPAEFSFPTREAELWLPAPVDPANRGDYTTGYLTLVGRLRPGGSAEGAAAEARAVARGLRELHPDRYTDAFGREAAVVPLRDTLVGDTGAALLLLLGAVGFVLLIACLNVANLLLVRAAARGREMAVRAALGAGRGRVVRQLLTESSLLALLGGAAGLLLAYWGVQLLGGLLPAELPGADEVRIDARVLAFTAALSLGVGLLAGLAPALLASRTELGGALRERSGSGAGRGRWSWLRSALVPSQVALALVLTLGAGLMLRSFRELRAVDPGFRAGGVLTLRVLPPSAGYAEAERRVAYWDAVLSRLAALPGVESVGAIHLLPLGGSNWNPPLTIEGREDRPVVDWRVATPGYFATAGVPVLRGRGFTAADREGAPPVALVSATLARTLFPGEDPIGRRVHTGFEGKGNWVEIVGVVGDTRDQTLAGAPNPQMYRPQAQAAMNAMTVMVRSRLDPALLAPSAREAVWSVDRDVPVSDVQPLERVVAESIARPRLLVLLLGGFGALALLLGGIGIYGVVSYGADRRSREFGVRMALGARPGEVLRLVLAGAGRLAAVGLAAGVAASLALTRLLAGQLYGVRPTDPATYLAVAALLAAVVLLAAYLPARRATRVDPVVALRAD
ncbi:MAG TPA: ABC transporter permease [Longimicrobiaceae bacterium]|nr:ABC transporter permease [Longimicrobiaceae bacterium]